MKWIVEHCEPTLVGFVILQYAKLRMLELYYNFFDKFCDVNTFEELEMDTNSFYLALAEKDLDGCILTSKRAGWTEKRSNDRSKHKKHDKREPGLFKEEFKCTEMLCLCSKTYCCYDSKSQKYMFSSKGLNKGALEDSGDGPTAKYRQVLDEAVKLISTNRGFKTINHAVATYEQTKKRLSYFYPKREVECDGIHTKPLNL